MDRESQAINFSTAVQPAKSSTSACPQAPVVVAGNLPSADGKRSLHCAVIVKNNVDEMTRSKASLNDLLRTTD